MNIIDILCNRANYGGLRGSRIKYIVYHYTANKNDTARDNGEYFSREIVGASAHYFVDDDTIVRSVPEEYVAWHCGDRIYHHDQCRNDNSIGIEICCKYENGEYKFSPAALENAKKLGRQLMKKYNIPLENVLRHWDVTHKNCPAPFTGKNKAAWETFKGGLIVYETIMNVPDWAKPTVQKLIDKGVLTGDETGKLNLSYDLVRTLVILDRLGMLDQ